MASTLKDNMDTIEAYKGTVFTDDFVEELQGVITPMMGPLQRLDNKDRSTNESPTQDDVLDVLEGVNEKEEVEHLFVDAFNACGPVLTMAINTLLHNPPEFANQTLRCTATEEFKANSSDENMMRYLLDSILMRDDLSKRHDPFGIDPAINNGSPKKTAANDHPGAPKGWIIGRASREDGAGGSPPAPPRVPASGPQQPAPQHQHGARPPLRARTASRVGVAVVSPKGGVWRTICRLLPRSTRHHQPRAQLPGDGALRYPLLGDTD